MDKAWSDPEMSGKEKHISLHRNLFHLESLILYKVLKWYIGIEKTCECPTLIISQIQDVREVIFLEFSLPWIV